MNWLQDIRKKLPAILNGVLPSWPQSKSFQKETHKLFNMPFFCTKCGVNWAVLDCQDDEASNSTYEVCPKCQNDLDLIEGKEGPTFVMQQFGGQILDALTKKPILHEQAKQNAIAESRGFDRSAYELKKERQVDKEDAAIDAYIKACESGGQTAGEAAFFSALKKDSNE